MVMLGQRWEKSIKPFCLYIDLNTLVHKHVYTDMSTRTHVEECSNTSTGTKTNAVNYCTHPGKDKREAFVRIHTHKHPHSKCGLITDFIARDAPAQRASVQTLNTDHRQAGQCFLLAREHYTLITPHWCFEAGARFGPHKPIFGPLWMRTEALMDTAWAELSSGLVLIM